MDPVTHGHSLPPPFHLHQGHHQQFNPFQSPEQDNSPRNKRDRDDDTTSTTDNNNVNNNGNSNNNNSDSGSDPNQMNRRPRGRPAGSKNKPKPPIIITRDSANALRTHVMEVSDGCDVMESVSNFARLRQRGVCILSGTGTVANVTILMVISFLIICLNFGLTNKDGITDTRKTSRSDTETRTLARNL